MPIYEFKCLKCSHVFELLVMNSDDRVEMCCPQCRSENFERIISTTSYSMAAGSSGARASAQTRTCSSGSCTTYDLPGHGD